MFSETYFEVDLVNRLQTVIEKQRSQIKKLDQKVLDYKTDSEEVRFSPEMSPLPIAVFALLSQLKCHNDKLTGCTRDLRRKTRLLQGQLREVSDERAELTAKLNDAHREQVPRPVSNRCDISDLNLNKGKIRQNNLKGKNN